MVMAADMTPEKLRLGDSQHLHVSSLIGICERLHVLSRRGAGELLRPVTGSDRLVWRLGRAVEAHVRTQFIQARQFAAIYGRWKCDNAACGSQGYVGTHDRTNVCICGRPRNVYHEPTLWDDENGIVGNPDLTFLHAGQFVVTEIKSMEKERFNELSEPLGDHVHQAILYRDLYQRLGFPVHDNVVVFYASKGYSFRRTDRQGRNPIYREFHVDATAPSLARLVSDSLASARRVKDHVAEGRIPPRVCTSSTCTRAKDCPLTSRCFSRD
jgi:hypothetical protein